MRRIRSSAVLAAAVVAGALLCACGGRGEQHQAAPERHGRLTNPSAFPLYPRSDVVVVVPVSTEQLFAAIKASDPKATVPPNYHGHEVIAETGATLRQLNAWIIALEKDPPRGLHEETDRSTARTHTPTPENEGAVGAQFTTANGDRSVYVVAADPKRIRELMGPAFALIDSYNAVPGMVRGPIDEQAKKQLGYTVTEMLDAKSPIGAILAEVKRLQNADRRAIVVIDTFKAR